MKKKKYFVAFDFWNQDQSVNKFYHTVFTTSLDDWDLMDMCRMFISNEFPDLDASEMTIKVNAFNNVDAP